MRRDLGSVGTRWLGVGLASCLAVVTVALWASGRLGLYINPDSAWFAVGMAVLLLAGAIASFALPLGAEADHAHPDHPDHPAPALAHRDHPDHPALAHRARLTPDVPFSAAFGADPRRFRDMPDPDPGPHSHPHTHAELQVGTLTLVGGLIASGVVVTMLVAPPATLSAELAMSRDIGAPPLFAGADVITLASSGDTSEFGVGDWASVFATATNPDTFDGDAITLTGFATPGGEHGFDLTRLVITHCVIDAQVASVPISSTAVAPDTGQWVTVTGTVRATSGGTLEITPDEVALIDEPQDPYEY